MAFLRDMPRNHSQKGDVAVHRGPSHASLLRSSSRQSSLDASRAKPLTPASNGVINSMTTGRHASSQNGVKHVISTIRSVPSFDGSETSPDSKRSAFTSSVISSVSAISVTGSSPPDRQPSSAYLKPDMGSENATTPSRWSGNGVRALDTIPLDSSILLSDDEMDGGQWDSTIGKAGLGKTGRVINRLVSENDALKRDIKIERLRAEEAKQAAKVVEDKMERMMSEHEGRLLAANVTKTLLARKERQVESLTAALELEKRKTRAAELSEKGWKDELDRMKGDTTSRVEEAISYAQLMEGRYNAISSHWRDQGDEVKRTMSKLRGEIATLVEERKSDDDKIATLRDLCEQQDSNIKELKREKEDIARLFDEYKKTQEESLRDIRMSAKKGEEEQERQLEEAVNALNTLKWALNVRLNVRGAR